MKILLIAPASGKWQNVAKIKLFNGKTSRFTEMKDRVFDLNWSNYDFHNVVFHPKGMSPRDLQAGHDWVTHAFYHPKRIVKRLWHHAKRPKGLSTLPYVAAINMAYYGRISNWKIQGWDPAQMDTSVYANLNKKSFNTV